MNTPQIAIRLDPETVNTLNTIREELASGDPLRRPVSLSDVIREAIREYVQKKKKKSRNTT